MEVLVTKPKPNWNFLTKTAFKYVLGNPIGILCYTSKVNVHTVQKLDWIFFHLIFIINITCTANFSFNPKNGILLPKLF